MRRLEFIEIDYSMASPFFDTNEVSLLEDDIFFHHNKIRKKMSPDRNALGWLDLPIKFDEKQIEKMKKLAVKVQETSDVFLIIGIGGSYAGARAGIEMLTHTFFNLLSKEERDAPQIFFVGHNLSSVYLAELQELIQEKDFSINVISKSGTTIETSIAFTVFRELLIEKYGRDKAQSRIYITTSESDSILGEIAIQENYETFYIPDDIGGRFSVLTEVGLFPMAVSGINIEEILNGAALARNELLLPKNKMNSALQYSAIRNILYRKGKSIEILASFEEGLRSFTAWWQQLFAESEGKDGKGLFPVTAIFSTDLHSLGQLIQDGQRNIFETIIKVEKANKNVLINGKSIHFNHNNYLGGNSVHFINDQALKGTLQAHRSGGVPNIVLQVPDISPYTFGYLVYFFQLACTISSYLIGVNPFDQPGVEAYKNNIYSLLKKPCCDSPL